MKRIVSGIGAVFIVTTMQAQSPNFPDSAVNQLLQIKDSLLLHQKLEALGADKTEKSLLTVANYYTAIRNGRKLDSVYKVALQRFPEGYLAFDGMLNRIYEEKDPIANEKHYQEMVRRFGTSPQFRNHKFFDYARYYVATSYYSNPTKLKKYLNLIKDSVYKTAAFSYAARDMYDKDQTELAGELIRKSLQDLRQNHDTTSPAYSQYAAQYSAILLKKEEYLRGLHYAQIARKQMGQADPAFNDVYLNLLVANKQYKEAYPLMLVSIREGRATPLVKSNLKKAFITVEGSETGYGDLERSLADSLLAKVKSKVQKNKVLEPGFDFILNDTNGKQVKMADYRGKTVILDFWATWCAPCKASFPNMQAAVNKYRKDTNVVFLFVHSWETSSTPVRDAAAYIKTNDFSFNVVMDIKSPDSGISIAAAGFNVKALPTKLIIDPKGNVRFRTVGSSVGASDEFLMEMSEMISQARS